MSEEAVVQEINELLEEMAEGTLGTLDPKVEVTTRMLVDRTGQTINTSYRKLHEREKAGELVSRWVKGYQGKAEKAWRKKGVPEPG